MTPTAIACRKATTESGKVMIHTDIYLLRSADELAPFVTEGPLGSGVTVTLPEILLKQLGDYAFRYWLDWVTVALVEPPGPELSVHQVNEFYASISGGRYDH